MPQQLFKEFAQLDQVEAIVLGGSRAGQHFDKDSDYDVYIYLTDSIAPLTRRDILSKYCSYMEIGNHRSSEFFASYFDLLFALNEQTHPGEKRMLEFAKTNCSLLPRHFEENIQTYFQKLYTDPAEAIILINQLVTTIKEIIPQEMIDSF